MKKLFSKILPLFIAVIFLVVFISPSIAFGASVNKSDYEKTPGGFVVMYYNSILNRQPAIPEVQEWVSRLNAGTYTAHSFVEALVFSEENKPGVNSIIAGVGPLQGILKSNNNFVSWVYEVVLMREPSAAEMNTWITIMQGWDWTTEDFLDMVVQSDEFANICKNFNVQPFSGEDTEETAFSAFLSGLNEVPPAGTEISAGSLAFTAGGTATFRLSEDGSLIFYSIVTDGLINIQAAHLHLGAAGTNGPVIVTLFPTAAYPVKPDIQASTDVSITQENANVTLATGTITSADFMDTLKGKSMATLISDIKAGKVYVNVHTSGMPNGAIRGQVK
jgi:hypothetical protein